MPAIGQLNSQQLQQVLLLGGAARYAEMYRYIATEIEANRLPISSASGVGIASTEYFWFKNAADINAGAATPAAVFIRAATANGLGVDPSSPKIQEASNAIGEAVFNSLRSGSIPDSNTQLQNDVSGALNAGGQTIGGWGGAFYYWNATYTDRAGQVKVVSQEILDNEAERTKFINATSFAYVEVLKAFPITSLPTGEYSNLLKAASQGFTNFGPFSSAAQRSLGLDLYIAINERLFAEGARIPREVFRAVGRDILRSMGVPLSQIDSDDDVATRIASDLTAVDVAGPPPSTTDFQAVRDAIALELQGRDLTGVEIYGNRSTGEFFLLLASGEQVRVNSVGQVGSTRIASFDDGSVLTTIRNYDRSSVTVSSTVDGVSDRRTYNGAGLPTGRELTTPIPLGTKVERFDGLGDRISTTTVETDDDGNRLVVVTDASGVTAKTYNADQVLIAERVVPPDASFRLTDQQVAVISDVTALINAIKSGDEVPIGATGLKLLNDVTGGSIASLATANTIGQGILSVYNLANAFAGGADDLTKVTSTLNTVNYVNLTFAEQGTRALSTSLDTLLNGSPLNAAGGSVGILPALGLIVAIKNEDPIGIAMSVGTMIQGSAFLLSNPIGWVLLAASLYKALEEPPEAWGIGTFKFGDATSLDFDVQGESFGKDRVTNMMLGNGQSPTLPDGSANPAYFGGMRGYLEELIADSSQANPSLVLGLIPQRMPTLTWREARQNDPGFAIGDVDPVTGQDRYPFLRYNDDGTPYNADATDPEQRRNLFERLIVTSLEREAIAPMWEVQTAKLQQDAGDPNAGLTEAVRAGKRGLLAPVDPLTNKPTAGEFRPIALDLDGDGRIGTVSDASNTRAFNWDGSGFDKQVGWVGAGEGMLFLDRNPNGQVDSGLELFSNSAVTNAAKGVRSLAWVDANGDGVLNSLDPVFAQLKVWQDSNGDAQSEALELQSLAALGIIEVDYSNNRFTRNGQLFSLQSQALEAAADGQVVSVVPDGVRVEFNDGRVLVYATRVADASMVARVAAVAAATAVEGGALDFAVSLNVPSLAGAMATLALYAGTALASDLVLPMQVSFNGGQTFVALAGSSVNLPAGTTQFVVRVQSVDDTLAEGNEGFTLGVGTAANATLVLAGGTVVDNDGQAQLSVTGPATAQEAAGTLSYTVTLSQASTGTVTVDYASTPGSAQAGSDFVAVAGSLVFAPGETSKTVTLEVNDDAQIEAGESFALTLANASGAVIAVAAAQTTILDNDTPGTTTGPVVVSAVSNASAVEGGALLFTLSLSAPSVAGTLITLALQDGSALQAADLALPLEVSFDGGQSFNAVGTASFGLPPGNTQVLVRVQTAGDATVEGSESFALSAATADNAAAVVGTGVIVDDDGTPQLSLTGPATAGEAAGPLTYTVSLSAASATTVTVDYASAAGTAQAGSDFLAVAGTLVFAPGETSKTFTLGLVNDSQIEAGETFSLTLANASGAEIAVAAVQTTIQSDDSFTAGDDDLGVVSEDYSTTPTRTPATGAVLWDLLLANDAFNGSAAGLSITAVGNGQHVSVAIDAANRSVLVTPQANYVGQASFDYTVSSAGGDVRVATAFLTFASVNDVPELAVQLPTRAIYGWAPRVTSTTVSTGSGSETRDETTYSYTAEQGEPIYVPFSTVQGQPLVTNFYGYGDSTYTVAEPSGAPVDTRIAQSYFQQAYAARGYVNTYDDNGYVTGGSWAPYLDFSWGGNAYRINASPATFLHDTAVATEASNDGTVSLSDIDAGGPYRFDVIRQPLYGRLGTDATTDDIDPSTGAFTYEGRRYVDFDLAGDYVDANTYSDTHVRGEETHADTFDVKVTDLSDPTGNTYVTKTITVTHYGPLPKPEVQSGGKKPIAIDLNGDGFHFTDVDDSNVFYNVNADGWRRRIAWNNPQDGFIAYDKNGDGKITEFDELSFVPYDANGQTDLDALRRAFDTNNDGVFSAADAKWNSFGVWQDADSDGVTDPGEFRTLDQLGINQIGLTSDGHFQVIDGQTVHGTAAATRNDGSTLAIADVTLRYLNETRITEPDGTETIVPVPSFQPGSVFDGTAGPDLVLGTTGSDMFKTGDGNDVINDDSGNDGVQAGAGDDLIYTGVDNDVIDGGAGNDTAFAGEGNDLVFGDDGDDLLMLEGGNDVAFGGAGQDFIGGGAGNDAISGDAGDDKLFGEGGWDALFGKDGDDELWGLDGNDLLYGDAGTDLLVGGAGDDAMDGGAGNDTYDVDSSGDTVIELAGEGSDSVRASIGYTLAETLENLTLTGTATIDGAGNAGNNVLVGNAAANRLTGLAGDDVLDGGLGADTMLGGVGDDTYVVDSAGDAVTELAGEGMDTVRSRISYALGGELENLTLIGIGAIDGTGNALANEITGNAASNTLDGGAGADTLRAGRGNDRYLVDDAGDQVVEASGEGYDTVVANIAGATYALGAEIEALELGTAANGVGNALDNVIQGNAGNNLLDGAAGADILIGGAGDDTYTVDDVNDLVVELAVQGDDTVRASVSTILAANVETLVLIGSAALNGAGNELANALAGNAASNVLDGAGGADAMTGGAGDDTYVVDNVGDLAVEQLGEGTDTVLAAVDYALAANIENLSLTGTASISGVGNDLNNTLTGNAANNTLDGAAGADAMLGGAGDDTYVVDNALDSTTENAAEGSDTVRADVSWTLGANVENLVLTGAAASNGAGNSLDNSLTGNASANVLDGGAGADAMTGGAGDDTYVVDSALDSTTENAAEGSDTVRAGVSWALGSNIENLLLTGVDAIDGVGNFLNNSLTGNAATNILDGGAGADAMTGGAGNDTYVVDNAGDSVVEQLGKGTDSVLASVSFTLSANVENLTLTGAASINGVGNDLNNVLAGNAGANTLDGLAGADAMAGGAGDDTYIVDNALDSTTENTAEGDDTVRADVSWTLGANVENLVLTGAGAINGTGNALDNSVIGNAAANVLDGGAGADAMTGGAGNDTYVVDDAGDSTVEQVGEGIDSVLSSVSVALADNVENLTLTGAAAINGVGNMLDNFITGNGADNLLQGGAGIDTLSGGAGNDILDGGTGADVMAGGTGDDQYVIDEAADAVSESVSAGFDRVSASINYVLPENVESLTLTGSALNATGNALDNFLFGNAQNNILDGLAGADSMSGAAGDDRFKVDNAGDTVVEAAGDGNDTVYTNVSYSLAANVENLVLQGAAALNANGNADDNVLVGNSGANILGAGDGADVLAGAQGNDLLDGGAGNDLYLYNQGDGRETVTDVSGTDVLRFGAGITLDSVAARTITVGGVSKVFISILGTDGTEQADQGIELNATGGIETIQFANGTSATLANLMVGSRTLNGTGGNDTLTGDRQDDTINAGIGNDVVYGRSGNDNLFGGVGADKLFGEGGNDQLFGESEADDLWGGAGNDLLDGGSGADRLFGGTGDDNLNGRVDADLLDGAAGNDVLIGDAGEDELYGGDGSDNLNGGTDADLLAAGAGDDTIVSGSGTAVVVAGTGNDLITTGTNADFIDAGAGNDNISADFGSDFIAAGRGNDTINPGGDADVVAFNRGDGADTMLTSSWQVDTLSLGGGIRYADLALRKVGSDLILDLGVGDSLTYKDWYLDASRRNVNTLQMMTGATGGDYSAASTDRMLNRKAVSYNFAQIVNRFDQLRAANPALTSWAPAGELNSYYLNGSNTQAIGGDLAWRYATSNGSGSYGDLGWRNVLTRTASMSATTWQTLATSTAVDPWTALQAGMSLIADQTVGLPSPITPAAELTPDQLVLQALTASPRPRPTWLTPG